MVDLLKDATFWTAVGSLAALIAIIITVLPYLRKYQVDRRKQQLNRLLKKERAFYKQAAANRDKELAKKYAELVMREPYERIEIVDKPILYLRSVMEGIEGLRALPQNEISKSRLTIEQLINELRTTHLTLLDVLDLFSLEDAEKFFNNFDNSKTNFIKVYNGGKIPSNARTHCSNVERLSWELITTINNGTPGLEQVRRLANSVVIMDREIIIPVMIAILEKTNVEFDLITSSMNSGDEQKAIWIKERYWFDVQPMVEEIRDTLSKMNSLISSL